MPVVYYVLESGKYLYKQGGNSWQFTDGNPDGLQWMNRVQLSDLKPGQKYLYTCESEGVRSAEFFFNSMRAGQDWEPYFLVYGDMGEVGGGPSLSLLIEETATGKYTGVIHVGDFAYDFNDHGGKRGDRFMENIQPIAAYLPYMTAVGNHEIAFNFSHYRNRFSMPGDADNMWYSWNAGPIHFIAYSTEVYFTNGPIAEQLAWLKQDLTEANTPENRKLRPWIMAYGHRPMYCSNIDGDDCSTPKSIIRAALETLFFEYGVDVIIEAHEHSYERLWPVYNETVTAFNYNNPAAPVHLISGAAGCNENDGWCFNPMLGPKGPWSAYRSWLPGLNGFGKLKVFNATTLYWEQMVDLLELAEDWITVEQEHHGPFTSGSKH